MDNERDEVYLSREDAITEIIEYKLECLYDDSKARDQLIEGIFRYGMTGIESLENKELIEMYEEVFDEKLILSDE